MKLPSSMTKIATALTLILSLFVVACDDDVTRPDDGSITGTVTASGQPLVSVVLQIEGPVTRTNTSADDGTYAFTDVPVGTYTVTVEQAPQDVVFGDPDEVVTITSERPDATANFDGTLN